MGKNHYIFVPAFLFVLGLLQCIHATKFTVTDHVSNTPGGKVFETYIGKDYTLKTMPKIQKFIYKVFEQTAPAEQKQLPVVNVHISDYRGYGKAGGDVVNVSGPAIDELYRPREKAKFIFTSLLYHETTHLFQWNGNGAAPGGLVEGIAHYVMVKSGYYDKDTYTKNGEGEKWDKGYGWTERFLNYCDGLKKGFTAALNKKMKDSYSDEYFEELLGKSVDQLWSEYKAKYAGNKTKSTSAGLYEHV